MTMKINVGVPIKISMREDTMNNLNSKFYSNLAQSLYGNVEPKIILLADFVQQNLRKERELTFYEKQLAQLLPKMDFIRKEIEITNIIINLVSEEKIIDIQDYLKKKET